MRVSDIEALENFLSRLGCLDSWNRELIEDAIYQLKDGREALAKTRLHALAANLRNDGYTKEAENVEYYL